MNYPPRVIAWPPGTEDYSVTLTVGEVNGRLECVGVSVQAVREACMVTSTTLRDIPVARLMADYARELRIAVTAAQIPSGPIDILRPDGTVTRATPEEQRVTDEFWARQKRWADELAVVLEKSGHYPPEHWEHVAEVYRAAARVQRNPTAAVGEYYGVTRSAAAKWVSRARDRGLLPPAQERVKS